MRVIAVMHEEIEIRPEVATFAALMEKTLRNNDHKGGWDKSSVRYLRRRLRQEMREFEEAMKGLSGGVKPVDVAKEAADVANFCMMIAERCGGMPVKRPEITPENDGGEE